MCAGHCVIKRHLSECEGLTTKLNLIGHDVVRSVSLRHVDQFTGPLVERVETRECRRQQVTVAIDQGKLHGKFDFP
jgi:hypothetical protein